MCNWVYIYIYFQNQDRTVIFSIYASIILQFHSIQKYVEKVVALKLYKIIELQQIQVFKWDNKFTAILFFKLNSKGVFRSYYHFGNVTFLFYFFKMNVLKKNLPSYLDFENICIYIPGCTYFMCSLKATTFSTYFCME